MTKGQNQNYKTINYKKWFHRILRIVRILLFVGPKLKTSKVRFVEKKYKDGPFREARLADSTLTLVKPTPRWNESIGKSYFCLFL